MLYFKEYEGFVIRINDTGRFVAEDIAKHADTMAGICDQIDAYKKKLTRNKLAKIDRVPVVFTSPRDRDNSYFLSGTAGVVDDGYAWVVPSGKKSREKIFQDNVFVLEGNADKIDRIEAISKQVSGLIKERSGLIESLTTYKDWLDSKIYQAKTQGEDNQPQLDQDNA